MIIIIYFVAQTICLLLQTLVENAIVYIIVGIWLKLLISCGFRIELWLIKKFWDRSMLYYI